MTARATPGAAVPRWLASWAASVALAFAATPARADPSNSALAESLYQAARDLTAQGNYAEACPKFAESYRVAPATGTLLNLAACHEAEGKLATAWGEFMEAAMLARRDGRADRVTFAEERSKQLSPKLSRLTLTAEPGVDVSALEIRLDGSVVGSAALGVAAPLDPGEHVVDVKSPGKRPFSIRVTLAEIADQKTVSIPTLVPEPAAPPRAAPQTESPPPAPPPKSERSRPVPTSAFVAGGATLALGVASAVTGAMYLSRRADYKEYRQTAQSEDDHGPDYAPAQTLGTINAILLTGTVVGAGLTLYLYATRPEAPVSTSRVTISVGPGFTGVAARGEF
jgi:hypothetical protein